MEFIDPKEFKLLCQDGVERTYILSKIPAVQAREILIKYLMAAIPKLGDFDENQNMMLRMMAYVAAKDKNGNKVPLTTATLINNHVKSWDDLLRIEAAMKEYNNGFFLNDLISRTLDDIVEKVMRKLQKI